MPSIYDDPRVSGGDRIRFEAVGDRVRGRITKAEVYVGQNASGYRYELAEAAVRQAGRQAQMPYAEVIATQTQLVPQLKDQEPLEGDTVDIELIDLKKTGGNFTMKVFNVATQKAAVTVPPNTTTPPPVAAAQDDLFG